MSIKKDRRIEKFFEGSVFKISRAKCYSDSNITLSGLQTIDNVSLKEGEIVLVNRQNAYHQNGLYRASSGTWVRDKSSDTFEKMNGSLVSICCGDVYTSCLFKCANGDTGVLGYTAIGYDPIPIKAYYDNSVYISQSGKINSRLIVSDAQQGDLVYCLDWYGDKRWVRVPIGTPGQVLTVNTAGDGVEWKTP